MAEEKETPIAQAEIPSNEAHGLADLKTEMDAILAARSQSDLAVGQINERAKFALTKCDEIDQMWVSAERAKTELDSHIVPTRDAVAAISQQVEAAKTNVIELKSLSESTQATSTQAKDTTTQAVAALEALRTLANTATESAGRIEALKTQVDLAAQVAAQRSQHIEEGREYVDKKRAEIDVISNSAQQSASNTEAQHQASHATVEKINSLHVEMQTTIADAGTNAKAVEDLRRRSEAYEAIAKKLADAAHTTEEKISAYELHLAELEKTAGERLKTIESLLPGAASAGLASAFNLRRQDLKWPPRVWQGLFIFSLLGMLVLGFVEVYTKVGTSFSWDDVALSMLYRLPFALPLVWLAIHSAHRGALLERIEEDYGFKETVSRLFEGYRREMADLDGKAGAGSALDLLCREILVIITNPPGRIYEKHRLNSSPMTALAASAGPVAEAASKVMKPT